MPIAIRTFFATAKRCRFAAIPRCLGLFIVLLLFALAVAFINPVREMMFGDDWAYGLTTEHLLATGEYRLHDWATANMPVQIYWAALLAQVFGYSFVALRFSTLLLSLVGLIALYWMLRDFGVKDSEASLLTVALFSSPVVLFLSFTFQTDVQLLGWQVLALWLYSRALRQQDWRLMALGSIAAFAAVGTRQFGVALVAGLFATWLSLERQHLRKAPLYLIGLGLPLLMTLWQFSNGLARPTFSQRVRLAEQLAYVRDLPGLAAQLLWRPTTILQYLGLFLLPLTPLLAASLNVWRAGNEQNGQSVRGRYRLGRSTRWLLAALTAYITAGLCYGYFIELPGIPMPSLGWLLPNYDYQFFPFGFKERLALTIITGGFAIGLSCLLAQRWLESRTGRVLVREERFVLLSGLALLGLQLLYVQFYDVYLIQFLPFAVVALGKTLPVWPRWCKALTAVLCFIMLSLSSLWTRGVLSFREASWQAAEAARSAGAAPQDVGGNMTWSCYHGAFDEWMVDIAGSDVAARYSGSNRMHFAFFDFLHKRDRCAQYVLMPPVRPTSDNSWRSVRTLEYRDRWLRRRNIYLLVRETRKGS